MVHYCCAYGCNNQRMPGQVLKFHRFPMKNPELLKLWIESVHRENFIPNVHTVICSDHFTEESYLESSFKKNLLKKDAVPTIFNFTEPQKSGCRTPKILAGSKLESNRIAESEKVDSDSGTSVDPLTVSIKQEDDDSMVEDYPPFEAEEHHLEEPITNSFKHDQDEFDAIGYNVASKLRTMDRKQRIIAERIIAETLFQGQMGILSVNTPPSDFVSTIVCENRDIKPDTDLPP